jgi:hypothetical protein
MPFINDAPLTLGPIVSISDSFSINDMFMISHGSQFRPIGALLGGLSKLHPVSDPFYERLGRSWLCFPVFDVRCL